MIQLLINGISQGAVYGLIAIGFGLIFAVSGVFHVAHASVCVSASYVAFVLINYFNQNIVTACFAGMMIAGILGVLIEMLVYKPLRKKYSHEAILLLSSIAVLIVLTNIVSFLMGEQPQVLVKGTLPVFQIADYIITYPQVTQVIIFIIVGVVYFYIIKLTKFGLVASAVAQNPLLSSFLGIRINRIRYFSFALGSAIAGLGFTISVIDLGIDPNSGMSSTIIAAVACIIVGTKRFIAPLWSGVILGVLFSCLLFFMPAIWVSTIAYLLLVVLLIFKPQGLLIRKGRVEEK